MESLDLLGFLGIPSLYGQLKDIDIYGKITEKLDTPVSLTESVKIEPDKYSFVAVDVFAIDLKPYNNFIKAHFENQNIINSDNKYMVNGSICCYIPKDKVYNNFYKLHCPAIRVGSTKYKNFVIGFGFGRTDKGFNIIPCEVNDFDIMEFDNTTEKGAKLRESLELNRVVRPSVVEDMPKFYADIPKYKEINTKTEMPSGYEEPQEQVTRVSNRKTVIESRKDVKPYSDNIKLLSNKVVEQQAKKKELFKQIADEYKENADTDRYYRYLIEGLCRYLKHKPTPEMSTGTKILKKYLTNFNNSDKLYLGMTVSDYITTSFDEFVDWILGVTDSVMLSGEAYDVLKHAFHDKQMAYAGLLSIILNIKTEILTDIVYACDEYDVSFINIVNQNPYILQYLSDGNIKFDTVESIAYAFGVNNNQDIQQYRNIAMLNSYMMTENENTIFRLKDLLKANIGMSFTKKKFEDMQSTGSYLKAGTLYNIKAYLHDTDFTSSYNISNFYYDKYKMKYLERMAQSEVHKAIRDMVETGMGIVITDDYITTTKLAEKECYVYDKMHTLGSKIFDYNSSEIDECINQYEKNSLGFTLEPEQRQAVHLLTRGAGVIAGSAGSGKTTVSNCLVYVLSTLEPNIDIKFAAPTGKAAKRMQEVVKQPVKTLHSMFKIGLKEEKGIDKLQMKEEVSGDNIAYFFDENAMVTLDVFYSVLKKIDEQNSRIFMFGDYNQLPPIGKGLVFKNLLKFMPCVALTVSKRAAEGSNITYNSNLITDFSDSTNFKPLKSGRDFYVLPTQNLMINSYVSEICKYYLGQTNNAYQTCKVLGIDSLPQLKVEPDDIQVVSPLGKPNYNWGTSVLNQDLQPIFNKNKGYNNVILNKNTFKTTNDYVAKYIIGDRVIHTEKNMYNMQWYKAYSNGVFEKRYGFGICNGEVGKIVGYCKAEDAEFMNENEIMPADFEYPDNLRDDATYREVDGYFVIVEYHDYITDSKYYILYRCKRNTSENESNEGINLYGEDFDKLSLFYAGTTHKLQGSQAKIIIAVMGNVSFKHFLTRNMLYTTVTRGQELVFLIGSAEQIAEARSEVADKERLTIGEIL